MGMAVVAMEGKEMNQTSVLRQKKLLRKHC